MCGRRRGRLLLGKQQLERGRIRSPRYFSTPMKISGLNGTVTAVTTNSVASCAQVSDKFYCWGDNNQGGLGIGSTDPVNAPVQVAF